MSLINFVRPVALIWCARIAIPFSWAASKNRVYHPHVRGGHLALREEVREYRALIGERLTAALGEQIVVQNRVWIALLVQKTAQKGDAINVVDTVCDAIKDVIGVDDRWFSIRYLDWQIVKENPRLYIEIGQESAEAVQACSSCGRILPFAEFQKNRANRSGHSRNCRECVRPRDLDRVAKRKAKAA